MARIFISHSANGDPFAAGVRDAVADKLRALGHTPLVDAELIHPGDRWRATLLGWLGSCDAAVVLITSRAADSDWVRAEATILGWRAWLNPAMRVVPVLLDAGASSATLDGLGLRPVQLRDIQVLKATEVDGDSADSLAEAIAGRFAAYAAGRSTQDPMARWLKTVLVHLDRNAFLEEAAECLGIGQDDLPLAQAVAHRLLHSNAVAIEQAFLELIRDPKLSPASFAPLISSAWLPADMGDALFAVAAAEAGPRVARATLTLPRTARRLLARVTCCDNRYVIVGPFSSAGAGLDDGGELATRYANAIVREVGASSEEQWAAAMASLRKARDRSVFVILGREALEAGVLERLKPRFDGVVFVCAGPAESLSNVRAVELIPPLPRAVEEEGGAAANRIEGAER
ncbi:toll/interleukin-1 receptor domain-containing protein [Dactylosporangium sp. CA-092794]|uniref:toll/interleukin-1 receptor domain-containing protein n=1 Tax=Dactylosporangium sp. CA-092794 TaxID=3239929 RepID=UPI003D8F2482